MVYAALTFWLFAAVLTAGGVYRLWCGLVSPKYVNVMLLPGTLVAQLGHVLGLLITGASVRDASLYNAEDNGEPETTQNPNPRIPFVGPVIIALLPLTACGVAIYALTRGLGGAIVSKMTIHAVTPSLPTTLAGFWAFLREQISLVESLTNVIANANLANWRTGVFLYLLICLAVRMAPLAGNLRGALGAILVLGVVAAVVGMFVSFDAARIEGGWAVANLTVAVLLWLLLASFLVRGMTGLVRVLRTEGQ